MSGRREPVPEWLVERLAKGDLSPRVAADVRSRLEATGALDRLAEIEASDRAVLAAHPPATVAAEVERRLRTDELDRARKNRTRRLFVAVPGAAVAVAASLIAFVTVIRPGARQDGESPPRGGSDGTPIAREVVTPRGLRPHLVVYRKTSAEPSPLERESRARPGDVLQLAYVAAGRRYGVVASVDARGTITLHLPEAPGAAPQLVSQGETALPHAFELDDSPGFERFVFVTADVPFSTAAVVDALRPDGASLPEGLTATEVVVEKELQ
jgi:hypothetical protein